MDVNHLADRTDAELKVLRGKQYTKHGYTNNGGMPFPHDVEREKDDVPENFDWRLYGAVTPVKGNFSNTNFDITRKNKNITYYLLILQLSRSICLWFLLEFWYNWSSRRCLLYEA